MARAAFGELHDGETSLLGLDGKPFEGRAEEVDVLFLSRLDCDVRCLELPPVPERELPSLIRYRLRSVYPGSLEHVVVDHVAQRRGSGLIALVCILDREALEKFRRAAPRAALSLLSAALLRKPAPRPNGCIVCESPRYTEVLKFEDGVLLESVLVKRSGSPCDSGALSGSTAGSRSDAQKILRFLGNGALHAPLVLAPAADVEDAVRRLSADGAGPRAPEARAMESLEFSRRGTAALFRPRRRWRPPRPAATRAGIAAAIVLLAVGLVLRQVNLRQAELSLLRSAVLGSQAAGQRTADLVAQYSAASARVSALTRDRPVDICQFFCDLRDELGPGVVIQDLVIQDGAFQFQAIGPGPLALMQRFIADPRFQAVRLLQTTPLAGGSRQQFIVTGRYAR
jgi:hypothetical protein